MASLSLKEQIISQLDQLTAEQQELVLGYTKALARPRGVAGKEFIARTRDIHIDPDDLRQMEQAIEEEFERLD